MPNAILNVGQTGGQVNISTAAAPATPAVGVVTLYAGTDKALHALNSDGTDITLTIGATGATGSAGATGATGSAGATGPESVSYDSTTKQFFTCTSPAPSPAANSFNVVYGNCIDLAAVGCALNYTGKTLIGSCIGSLFNQTGGENCEAIAIGYCISSQYRTINIGFCQAAQNGITIGWRNLIANNAQIIGQGNDINGGWAVGTNNCGQVGEFFGCDNRAGNYSVVIGKSNCAITYSNAIGNNNVLSGGDCQNSIGYCNRTFPGSTGAILIGTSNVGGTGACNSVVIGNSAQTTCTDTIAIGNQAKTEHINSIAIGLCACTNTSSPGGIAIGQNAKSLQFCSVAIGANACSTNELNVAVGPSTCNTGARSAAFGWNAVNTGNYGTVIGGQSPSNSGSEGIAIGTNAVNTAPEGIAISYSNVSACRGIAIGYNSCSSHTCAVVLGAGLSSTRTNTTHVQSLVAFGQAASLTNAVGSTGGSVTLNWDNSNIQTLTLTSNITTLTKSNPIDGAVYTLFLTQGGTGGKTVSWGTDVEWPGGTPPTLSTAAGSVDAVSLIYIAGVTGYYGNSNLNFS